MLLRITFLTGKSFIFIFLLLLAQRARTHSWQHEFIYYALSFSPGLKGIGRQRNRSTPVTFGSAGRENMRPLVPGSPKFGGSPSSSPVATTKKHLAAAFVDDATLFSPIDEEADLDDPLGNLLKKSMRLQKGLQEQNENTKNNAQTLANQQTSKTLTNEETVALVTEQDESSNDFVLVDLVSLSYFIYFHCEMKSKHDFLSAHRRPFRLRAVEARRQALWIVLILSSSSRRFSKRLYHWKVYRLLLLGMNQGHLLPMQI